MRDEDYARLLEDTQHELLAGVGPAAVLGLTPVTLRLLASLAAGGLDRAVDAVYAPRQHGDRARALDSAGAAVPGAERG